MPNAPDQTLSPIAEDRSSKREENLVPPDMVPDEKPSEHLFRQQRDLITFVQQASRTAFWKMNPAAATLSFDVGAMRLGGRLLARAHDATRFSPKRAEGQPGLRIVIADTGHGMPSSVMARVFEPFYTTKALNGTGLGLWISSGIVARHNGSIRIRSSEHPLHHGTVFSLFLPHISEAEIEASAPLLS